MPDDGGRWYVDENTFVSTMRGPAADDRHYTCPVAAVSTPWVHTVLRYRGRLEAGERLIDTLDGSHPSATLRGCIDIASRTIGEIREAQREWRDAKRNKGK